MFFFEDLFFAVLKAILEVGEVVKNCSKISLKTEGGEKTFLQRVTLLAVRCFTVDCRLKSCDHHLVCVYTYIYISYNISIYIYTYVF